MKATGFLLVLTLVGWGTAHADEHPACGDLNYPYTAHTSSELRAIARSCTNKAIADLYYHRARHLDLVDEGEVLSGLIPYSGREESTHFDTYRIYIGLLEAFSSVWYPEPVERADFLNEEYERLGEVERLRLRGYDNLADRLEHDRANN
jgi:hypothetical protein